MSKNDSGGKYRHPLVVIIIIIVVVVVVVIDVESIDSGDTRNRRLRQNWGWNIGSSDGRESPSPMSSL